MDFGRSPGCQSVIVTSAGMALSLGLAWQGLFGEIDRKTINPVENSIGHFVLESVPGVNSRLRFGVAGPVQFGFGRLRMEKP